MASAIHQKNSAAEARRAGLAAALPHGVKLSQLRYALCAQETGSFRRTAVTLNLQQSTISRRIRDLEERLGVRLFDRRADGVRPTSIGEQFLARARQAAEQLVEARALTRPTAAAEGRMLRVGLIQSLGPGPLEAALAGLVDAGVTIAVAEDTPQGQMLGLKSRRLDIAFLPDIQATRGLQVRRLWSEPLVAVMVSTHGLAQGGALRLRDLRAVAAQCADDPFGQLIAARFKLAQGENDLAPADRPRTSTMSLLSLAALGQVVMVTGASAAGWLREGLVARPVCDAAIEICAVWSTRNTKPALKRILGALKRLTDSAAAARAHAAPARTRDRWP